MVHQQRGKQSAGGRGGVGNAQPVSLRRHPGGVAHPANAARPREAAAAPPGAGAPGIPASTAGASPLRAAAASDETGLPRGGKASPAPEGRTARRGAATVPARSACRREARKSPRLPSGDGGGLAPRRVDAGRVDCGRRRHRTPAGGEAAAARRAARGGACRGAAVRPLRTEAVSGGQRPTVTCAATVDGRWPAAAPPPTL